MGGSGILRATPQLGGLLLVRALVKTLSGSKVPWLLAAACPAVVVFSSFIRSLPVPLTEVRFTSQIANVVFVVGASCAPVAFWLSGLVFSSAPHRLLSSRTLTAGASICFALIGPPMFYYGLMLRLAWYPPPGLGPGFGATDFLGGALILGGLSAVVAAIWLSGYSYRSAPRRSLLAALILIAEPLAWYLSLR